LIDYIFTRSIITNYDSFPEKYDNVRNAWRELNGAIMKFNSDEKVPKDEVIKAYNEGEKRIGDVGFSRG